ncbi:hypothetical protein [Lacunimicrobium album]
MPGETFPSDDSDEQLPPDHNGDICNEGNDMVRFRLLDQGSDRTLQDSDSIDIETFRVSQGFDAGLSELVRTRSIEVRKPNPNVFVRTHPDNNQRFRAFVYSPRGENNHYLVSQDLVSEFGNSARCVLLTPTLERGSTVPFLWLVPVPTGLLWHATAFEAAELAKTQWVRVTTNMPQARYDIRRATAIEEQPDWSAVDSVERLVPLAFTGRLINSINHPVLQALRGER